jgi:tetratricopeptide (TPR) repeat protein
VVSHLVIPIGTYREVRFVYPLLGSGALLAGLAVVPVKRLSRSARWLGSGALVVAGTAAVVAVVVRNRECQSDLTLWRADVTHRPRSASAHVRLGDVLEMYGRTTEAEPHYRHATEYAPSSFQAWYQLAGYYERAGRPELTLSAYERAVDLRPDFILGLRAFATALINSNQLDRAQAVLLRAEQIDRTDPWVQYNLAVVDDGRGDTRRAVERLEAILAVNPDFTPARRGLEQLRRANAGRGP